MIRNAFRFGGLQRRVCSFGMPGLGVLTIGVRSLDGRQPQQQQQRQQQLSIFVSAAVLEKAASTSIPRPPTPWKECVRVIQTSAVCKEPDLLSGIEAVLGPLDATPTVRVGGSMKTLPCTPITRPTPYSLPHRSQQPSQWWLSSVAQVASARTA